MLRCKECGRSDTARIGFTNAVELFATVLVPGEKQVKLLKELGAKPPKPRFVELELVTVKNISELELDLSLELTCAGCGHKGTIKNGDFIIGNTCNCGRVEENIFICRRFKGILCPSCVDVFECQDCRFTECLYNPEYTGDEKRPEPTYQRTRSSILRDRMRREPPPIQFTDVGEEEDY